MNARCELLDAVFQLRSLRQHVVFESIDQQLAVFLKQPAFDPGRADALQVSGQTQLAEGTDGPLRLIDVVTADTVAIVAV